MGKKLYDENKEAKQLFEEANRILNFRITDVMFDGTDEDLKETKVTQPAVYIYSTIAFLVTPNTQPAMTAGHSLGEFSALVAAQALSFNDGLILVSKRAEAMQKACEINPSTMAAVLGLDDQAVEKVCAEIQNEIVVPANYNCPGQLVISGTITGVEKACIALKEAGAKRAMMLKVGGAFHSPLMEPAQKELQAAIEQTNFLIPKCPVYQNVDAQAHTDPNSIKTNLINQLTAPVLWTQIIENMIKNRGNRFVECGPGNVLQGLVKKISKDVITESIK
jgi:[acyl-carrier-protein] S-malonyltransferase